MGVVGFDQIWSTALGTPVFVVPSNLTLLDVATLTFLDVMQVAFTMINCTILTQIPCKFYRLLFLIINLILYTKLCVQMSNIENVVPAGGGQFIG